MFFCFLQSSPSCRDFLCFFLRWWWWWLWHLSDRCLRWSVWLWWWPCSFVGPAGGPRLPSPHWWRGFTPGPLVIPAPEHPFTPWKCTYSSGLWTARVGGSCWGSGHLELQEGQPRRALWTIWRRTQVLSPRPHPRLGGRSMLYILDTSLKCQYVDPCGRWISILLKIKNS